MDLDLRRLSSIIQKKDHKDSYKRATEGVRDRESGVMTEAEI